MTEKPNQSDFAQALGNHLSASPLIYGILLAGVALRLTGLTVSALHYDEAFSLTMARQGLLEMIQSLTTNISPPGWEILVWFIVRLLGYNELAVRIIPFLASVATLWIAYRLTQELDLLSSHQVVALALLAFLPYQFWMAQEARAYAIYGLLYTLGILWALQGRWLGLGAVMGLLLWFHNTAVFYVPVLLLLALLRHARAWKSIVGVALLAAISWVVWFPIVLPQAGHPLAFFPRFTLTHIATNLEGAFFDGALRDGWALFGLLAVILSSAVALANTLKQTLDWLAYRRQAGNAQVPALPLKSLTVNGQTGEGRDLRASPDFLLMLVVVVPLVLFFAFSVLIQNVFIFRPLSVMVPVWVMWLAPTITFQTSIRGKRMFARMMIPALWTWVIVAGLAGWSPNKAGNLLDIVNLIRDDWRPGDIIYHSDGSTAVLFQYYLPNQKHFLIEGVGSVTQVTKLDIPAVALENIPYQRAWVVWLSDEVPNERMANYVKNCQIVSSMFFWLSSRTTQVYICRRAE